MFSVAVSSFCCLLVSTKLVWVVGHLHLLHLLHGLSIERILLSFLEGLSSMELEYFIEEVDVNLSFHSWKNRHTQMSCIWPPRGLILP